MFSARAMAMAMRGHRRADEIVLVGVHVGDVEKTTAELPGRPRPFSKCIGPFDLRGGDREGTEERREKTQHDCLGPVGGYWSPGGGSDQGPPT